MKSKMMNLLKSARKPVGTGLFMLLIVTVFSMMAINRRSRRNVFTKESFLENISYSQLRGEVVDMYYASDDQTDDVYEQFDAALTAMEQVEEDGEPVPIDGVNGLFVGSIGAAYNLDALQHHGITHILSLENAAPCKWPGQFHCLHITNLWDDEKPENRISQHFDQTLPFIDNALTSGGHILVHCWAGKSRSVSTIAAFLIKYEHKTPEEVLAQIRVNRPHAQPNVGYMEELFDFYAEQAADWKVHNDN